MARRVQHDRRSLRLIPANGSPRHFRSSNLASLAAIAAISAIATTWHLGYADVREASVGAAAVTAPLAWNGDLSPISPTDWSYARAGHLLERAGFGGTPEEIEKLARMTPEQAVSQLLDYESNDNSFLPAFDESGIYDPGVEPAIVENIVRHAINEGNSKGESIGVKVLPPGSPLRLQPVVSESYYHLYANQRESRRVALWWTNRMLQSNRPLEEKISIFWHDHFATNYGRVNDYRKLLIHLATLHKHATGNFRDFVLAIAQDPAMLVYLDNGTNVKGHANENFAREVLELFTMGEGRGYTEQDIREAARAFTGWTQQGVNFVIKQDLHDNDKKTIFGETGNFGGEGVVDLIMKQPATALYISQKIYNYFVADDMPAGMNERLAERFRGNKYEIKPLLRTLFLSKDFYSAHAYATQIKSPAHLIVSTCKKLGLQEIPGTPDYHGTMVALGQELLAPPNVAGWEWGRTWINPATLLERGNYVHSLFDLKAATPARPAAAPAVVAQAENRQMTPPAAPGSPAQMQGANAGAMPAQGAAQNAGGNATNPNNRYATTETYNLARGVREGTAKATQRVKAIPRTQAAVNLTAMARGVSLQTPEQIVDYFSMRFLRVPLRENVRKSLVDFVSQGAPSDKIDYNALETEALLRELVHLIMSSPEYQLS